MKQLLLIRHSKSSWDYPEVADETHSVALVGHNPAITLLCNSLTHSDIDNIPTSGIVGIVSDSTNWLGLSHKNATLDFIDTPKAKLET